MEAVFQWIKNITCYLLFTSLLSYLMPAGKYEQYMKLFFGAVLILLVVHPLTGGMKLEGRLAQAYERICFTQGQGEFQQKLWGMEEERTKQMIEEYEKAVSRDIRAMAEEEDMHCLSARARIECREEDENFGRVVEILLVLGEEEGEAGKKDRGKDQQGEEGQEEKMVSIDPVNVVIGQEREEVWRGEQEERKKIGDGGQEEEIGTVRSEEQDGSEGLQEAAREKTREAAGKFQRKVAEYYGLEEEAVRITWKDN